MPIQTIPQLHPVQVRRTDIRLERVTFTTSRLAEFCTEKELVKQTGHAVEQWPLVVLKELLDNSLDAVEEEGRAPTIAVSVADSTVTVTDNGPGIPGNTIKGILDYSSRTSSREAYVSPTRGAQGNALSTLFAMPYVLGSGETVIDALGVQHRIRFAVDQVQQIPMIECDVEPSSVKNGTTFTIRWPDSARSIVDDAKLRFLQIAEDFAWINPHLSLSVDWNGERLVDVLASDPSWEKWCPSDPTSAHWYNIERLRRLMGAQVAHGRNIQTREFVSEFRGLSGTAKQKSVIDDADASRRALSEYFIDNRVDEISIGRLLDAMKKHSRPVKPKDLGIIGKDHFAARFAAAGADLETFKYQIIQIDNCGVPSVAEVAFGVRLNDPDTPRRIVAGVNWSVGINNPFSKLGQFGESLDSILTAQRSGRKEPVIFVMHLACPRIEFTDHGKSALSIGGAR
jgi:hypothetical protein